MEKVEKEAERERKKIIQSVVYSICSYLHTHVTYEYKPGDANAHAHKCQEGTINVHGRLRRDQKQEKLCLL